MLWSPIRGEILDFLPNYDWIIKMCVAEGIASFTKLLKLWETSCLTRLKHKFTDKGQPDSVPMPVLFEQ
jgi:hypothetical protein